MLIANDIILFNMLAVAFPEHNIGHNCDLLGFIDSGLTQKGSNSTHTLYCTTALVLSSSACWIALPYTYIIMEV